MKVIFEAILNVKKSYDPQKGWWSYEDGEFFYLCRYGHIIGKFKDFKLVESANETRTDTVGLNFLIKYFEDQLWELEN